MFLSTKTSAQALLSLCIKSHLKLTRPPPLMRKWRKQNVPYSSRCVPPPWKCSLSEMEAMAPWKCSPCKLKQHKSLSSSSQGFCSNPHEVRPSPSQDMRPPLLQKSQVKNESPKCLYPLFSLLMPTLKDQWPRLDLAKSNQWVRSTPIISLWKPTFLTCFMSINSPTLWINCHFMT